MSIVHTPMRVHEKDPTTVLLGAVRLGGFSVGACPDPVTLAALIVNACNAHAGLLLAANRLIVGNERILQARDCVLSPYVRGTLQAQIDLAREAIKVGSCGL